MEPILSRSSGVMRASVSLSGHIDARLDAPLAGSTRVSPGPWGQHTSVAGQQDLPCRAVSRCTLLDICCHTREDGGDLLALLGGVPPQVIRQGHDTHLLHRGTAGPIQSVGPAPVLRRNTLGSKSISVGSGSLLMPFFCRSAMAE